MRFKTESGAFQGRFRCFKFQGITRCVSDLGTEPGVSTWQNQVFHSSESGVSGQRTKYFMAESGMFQGKIRCVHCSGQNQVCFGGS